MKRLLGLAVVVMLTTLMSCGGGGNGGGSIPPGITVKAGDRLSATVGDAVITSGVFPITGNVTINERPAPKVAQPTFTPAYPLLTISSEVMPNGGFTVSYPDTSGTAPAMAGIFNGKEPIGAFPVTKQNGQLVIAVEPAYLPEKRSRSVWFVIPILLGIISHYLPPDYTVRLRPVGVQGEGQSLIYVPGLLQNADAAESTVSAVKTDRGYGSAYIVDYDWRALTHRAGEGLANALAVLPAKNADLVGYSKGGLVGRWAFEEFGATKAVKRAIFMGGPHDGCALTLAALYSLLAATFLKSSVILPMVFDPDSNCLTELMRGSQTLQTLNFSPYQQNGKIDYYFVAGQFGGFQTDLVVGTDSALLTGSSAIGNRTNGTIRRFTVDGQTHFTLDEAPVINAAMQKMTTASTGVEISFSSNPVEVSLDANRWTISATFTNWTNQRVTNEALLLETYDLPGDWTNNAWYDPSKPGGASFPDQRTEWSYALNAGESITLNIGYWPSSNRTPIGFLPPNRWASSMRFILLARGENGVRYDKDVIVKLTTPNNVPNDPKTRAVHTGTKQTTSGGFSLHRQ